VRRALPLLLLLLCTFAAAPAGSAAPQRETKPLLGVLGDADRFRQLTGQRSTVRHAIIGWDQGRTWGKPLPRLLQRLRPIPMLGLGTSKGWPNRREAITPAGIAAGRGDAFLVALNRAIHGFRGRVYLRPLAEMNAHWNVYSAFDANGASRGRSHSTAAFRKAFARIYVIAHGGTGVAASLRRLGLPPVRARLAANPRLRVIWNPQGFGAPNTRANAAQAYYPGDRYVDVVGNDLYHQNHKAEWSAADALYRAHPSKPYAFPEWGLWGIDDPRFVARMVRFVRSHRRVELISFYDAKRGSTWDLASKPRSRAAYRRLVRALG
jgi:Glycosyl hydrolase family 26